jgi:Tol biopolymer transport system component
MPAQAAFPGANGRIAYASLEDGDYEVFVMNSDGTSPVQLTHNTSTDWEPAWSPDGKKIAFSSDRDETDPECTINGDLICNSEIYVMNADGTGQTRITTNPAEDDSPAWTPDGSHITFTRTSECAPDGCTQELRTTQPDGSGEVFQLDAGPGSPSHPAWAPNGRKMINESYDWSAIGGALYTINSDRTGEALFCCTPIPGQGGDNPPPGDPDWSPVGSAVVFDFHGVSVQNADGSGFATIASGTTTFPAWSPDGTRIAFVSNRPQGNGIYVMDRDGANQAFIRPGQMPDWQPIPINAYPRPLATEALKATLALAYEPCTSPNRTHGPPLENPSCAPPVNSSSQLTVGTFDANGRNANAVAKVVLAPIVGDPTTPADEADIGLHAEATDVRLASNLSDYTGALEARMTLRITDKDNTPSPGGPGAATVKDMPYAFSVPCSPTAANSVGASCAVDTTADTLVPGTVKEKRRTVWEVGQVALHDGAGNAFMRQGLFVP